MSPSNSKGKVSHDIRHVRSCGKAMRGSFSWFTRKLDKDFQSTVVSYTSQGVFPFFCHLFIRVLWARMGSASTLPIVNVAAN